MSFWIEDHDFKRYPELTNSELQVFGFVSPHVQIDDSRLRFNAIVVKVHDGDTITLRTDFRDFDFPLRLASIDAPELNTGVRGEESRDFLKGLIEGEMVEVQVNPDNRVGKYGRLLGNVIMLGQDVGELMLIFGYALPFSRRLEGEMIDLNKELRLKNWF